jgi:hypothetical protein
MALSGLGRPGARAEPAGQRAGLDAGAAVADKERGIARREQGMRGGPFIADLAIDQIVTATAAATLMVPSRG